MLKTKLNQILESALLVGIFWLAALPLVASGHPAHAADPQPAVGREPEVREIMALTYQEGKTISVKLKGTWRLPGANGEAKVERKKGATEIEIELDEMKPAHLFGGDFNTYVLWAVSPEGLTNNLGEFILQGNRAKLNVSTRLETFGIFITAEPHFLVRTPSRFVVVENTRSTDELRTPLQASQIRYRSYEGLYAAERDSLANAPESQGEQRTELQQARTAVSLAERGQAEKYAVAKLAEARLALRKTEEAQRGGMGAMQVTNLGKETVRLAYEAQQQTEEEKRAEEKRAQAAEKARLEAEAADANRRAADEAAKREEAAHRAEEAARRAVEEAAKREEAARRAEEAARQAEAASHRAEEASRRAAEEVVRRQQAEAAAAQSAREAERAGQDREEARARMQKALGMVAETRESARGIIVNLPDILFDFNQATLRPEAREVISRIAGILMVTPGFRLKVEGHTDSVGTDEHNQKLSEKRAQAVKDYLVSANISPDLISTEGFGKMRPIADNTTNEGRKKNRRVEIIIEDIGVSSVP